MTDYKYSPYMYWQAVLYQVPKEDWARGMLWDTIHRAKVLNLSAMFKALFEVTRHDDLEIHIRTKGVYELRIKVLGLMP